MAKNGAPNSGNTFTGFKGNGIEDAGKSGGKMSDGPKCNETWGVSGHGIEDEGKNSGKLMPIPGNNFVGFTGKGIVDSGS